MNARRKKSRKKLGCLGIIAVVFGAVILLSVVGSLFAGNAGDTDASMTLEETSAPIWNPPSDGVWPKNQRGIGYGETFHIASAYVDSYAGAIQAPPAFDGYDGKAVIMSQKLLFTRIDSSASGVIKISDMGPHFLTGRDDMGESTPSALAAGFRCENEIPNVGDTTVCTVSVKSTTDHVANSSWLFGKWRVGAWPGQETMDF